MKAAQRVLPRAKGSRIARAWKGRAVSLSREGRRSAAPAAQDHAPQSVRLPLELIDQVMYSIA